MDENRLKHSIAVAGKMVEIAKSKELSEKEIERSKYERRKTSSNKS